MTFHEMLAVLDCVQYKDWRFRLTQGPDHCILQVAFWALDPTDQVAKEQTGRKWIISHHATRSELVQTAFKAVITAEEHEARETFTYKRQPIFGPHYSVDFLASYCHLDYSQDRRAMPAGSALGEEPAP